MIVVYKVDRLTRSLADFAKLVEPFDIIEGAQPPLRPLHLVVRETEFCGQRLAGDFSRRMRENGRNSVRRPRHASLTERNCEGFCRPGNRVGLPVLYGGGCSLVKRLSINEMANYVLADAELKDPEYLEKHIWRPSRPVIHLATAAAIIGQKSQGAGQGIQLESYLSRSDLIKDLFLRAEVLALIAERDAHFPVEADQLIRIRLT